MLNGLASFQDGVIFDESFSQHLTPASQIRVTVVTDDDDDDRLDSTTVSLDPAGGESRQHLSLNDSRLGSYGCDMDMETYQAELAEATNALLVADKCKKTFLVPLVLVLLMPKRFCAHSELKLILSLQVLELCIERKDKYNLSLMNFFIS